MMEARQEKQEKSFDIGFMVGAIILCLLFGWGGFAVCEKAIIDCTQLPSGLIAVYQWVKNIQEIGGGVGITVWVLVDVIIKAGSAGSKHKRTWIAVVLLGMACCLVFSMLIGYSVAEKNKGIETVEQLPGRGSIYTPELVVFLDEIYFVHVNIIQPFDTSGATITGYEVEKFEPVQLSLEETVRNVFSALVYYVKCTNYVAYEIELKPIYEDPDPDPGQVRVIIEEVLVEKDSNPLIKSYSRDSHTIYYGSAADQLKEAVYQPTREGHILQLEEGGTCYVQWKDQLEQAERDHVICFEDYYMDFNGSFTLNADSLQTLLKGRIPSFAGRDLKISIKETDGSSGPQMPEPPLRMSTREGRILYHWQDEQNSFYFAINNLANGLTVIYKKDIQQEDYVLLCELTIE